MTQASESARLSAQERKAEILRAYPNDLWKTPYHHPDHGTLALASCIMREGGRFRTCIDPYVDLAVTIPDGIYSSTKERLQPFLAFLRSFWLRPNLTFEMLVQLYGTYYDSLYFDALFGAGLDQYCQRCPSNLYEAGMNLFSLVAEVISLDNDTITHVDSGQGVAATHIFIEGGQYSCVVSDRELGCPVSYSQACDHPLASAECRDDPHLKAYYEQYATCYENYQAAQRLIMPLIDRVYPQNLHDSPVLIDQAVRFFTKTFLPIVSESSAREAIPYGSFMRQVLQWIDRALEFRVGSFPPFPSETAFRQRVVNIACYELAIRNVRSGTVFAPFEPSHLSSYSPFECVVVALAYLRSCRKEYFDQIVQPRLAQFIEFISQRIERSFPIEILLTLLKRLQDPDHPEAMSMLSVLCGWLAQTMGYEDSRVIPAMLMAWTGLRVIYPESDQAYVASAHNSFLPQGVIGIDLAGFPVTFELCLTTPNRWMLKIHYSDPHYVETADFISQVQRMPQEYREINPALPDYDPEASDAQIRSTVVASCQYLILEKELFSHVETEADFHQKVSWVREQVRYPTAVRSVENLNYQFHIFTSENRASELSQHLDRLLTCDLLLPRLSKSLVEQQLSRLNAREAMVMCNKSMFALADADVLFGEGDRIILHGYDVLLCYAVKFSDYSFFRDQLAWLAFTKGTLNLMVFQEGPGWVHGVFPAVSAICDFFASESPNFASVAALFNRGLTWQRACNLFEITPQNLKSNRALALAVLARHLPGMQDELSSEWKKVIDRVCPSLLTPEILGLHSVDFYCRTGLATGASQQMQFVFPKNAQGAAMTLSEFVSPSVVISGCRGDECQELKDLHRVRFTREQWYQFISASYPMRCELIAETLWALLQQDHAGKWLDYNPNNSKAFRRVLREVLLPQEPVKEPFEKIDELIAEARRWISSSRCDGLSDEEKMARVTHLDKLSSHITRSLSSEPSTADSVSRNRDTTFSQSGAAGGSSDPIESPYPPP